METGIHWRPFKDLSDVSQQFALNKNSSFNLLKLLLRKHKPEFLSLLKNQPKHPDDRTYVKRFADSSNEGDPKVIDETFIEEALIISDLFNLNERVSVDLLLAGEQQKPNYINYSRGLVAVLLYWDGRRNLVSALRTLIQCRKGRTWTLDLTDDAVALATSFTDELLANGLTQQILKLLSDIQVEAELEKLAKQKGLGDARHRRQIRDLITEVRQCLSDCLFYFAGQSGLPKNDVIAMISHIRQHAEVNGDGKLSQPTIALLFAVLYCIRLPVEPAIDQEDEGADDVYSHPLLSDKDFISSIHKVLVEDRNSWNVPGVRACFQLAWSLTLRSIAQSTLSNTLAISTNEMLEQDDVVLELALSDRAFLFIKESVVSCNSFHTEEFYLRRVHEMVTDLIANMPIKVKEMRNDGDEIARIKMLHLVEGEKPPPELRENFFQLMELITELYDKDPLNLELSAEYWCSSEQSMLSDGSYIGTKRVPHRQMSLFKFMRQSGDMLPPLLYIPYLHMLAALSTGVRSSRAAFEMLRNNGISMSGNGETSISWDHFFTSCHRYYDNLRQDRQTFDINNPISASQHNLQSFQMMNKICAITPQEVEGLRAVMRLLGKIAQYDDIACVAFYEEQHWSACNVLYGLLQCSIPARLKGDILVTLSHFGRLPDIAVGLLQTIEYSQLLPTLPNIGKSGGIAAELEKTESSEEEYPMTRGFITLLSSVAPLPVIGEGFNPYLVFVVESVYLRLMTRGYLRPQEKWEVASCCLLFFNELLLQYQPLPEHFKEERPITLSHDTSMRNNAAPSLKLPGFSLLLYIFNKGNFFETLMRTIEECSDYLKSYVTKHDMESTLVEATEKSMELVLNALEVQESFVNALRSSESSLLVTSLDKLLLGINPRTGKPDYVITIARFISHNATHLQLSFSALRIISWLCFSSTHRQVVTVLMNSCNQLTRQNIVNGFVEILDTNSIEEDEEAGQSLLCQTRLVILRLLIHCIDQPSPNFSHLLLGFGSNKPPRNVNLQDPGVLGASRSCLHSVLSILSTDASQPVAITESPKLAELCYQLIYRLAFNTDTTEALLRYLRSSYDFLFKHLHYLPFKAEASNVTIMQQSWLLKTVAIELHVLASKHQRTNAQRLIQILLNQPTTRADTSGLITGLSFNQSQAATFGDSTLLSKSFLDTSVKPSSNVLTIIQILDIVELSQVYPSPLILEEFISSVVEEGIKSCESTNEHGVVFCDIKMLHQLLESSLNTLASDDVSRRRLASQDVQNILQTAVERNQMRETLHAKLHFLNSWKQALEVALTSCPDDLVLKSTRKQALFTILQHLVKIVQDSDAALELVSPIAAVVLTLVMQIRSCLMPSLNSDSASSSGDGESHDQINDLLSLQLIIHGILEWLLQSGINQKPRVYLYAALLHYLQLSQQTKYQDTRLSSYRGLHSAREDVYSRITRENVNLFKDYGDSFMDLLCKDAFSGHSICRVLAFGCLDSILQIDGDQIWLQFMINNGYLNNIAKSFAQDDESLQQYLNPTSGPLRSVYIYEQKMALLCSIVHSPGGARAVIDGQVLPELSRCNFLEMRPNMDYLKDASLDVAITRYRQLLFPVLHLCSALLTVLGGSNHHEVCAHVLQFILSHAQPIVMSVLRLKADDQQSLTELKLVTAILSQTSGQNFSDVASFPNIPQVVLMEIQGHMLRIQRQLLALFPHFLLTDEMLNNIKARADSSESSDQIILLTHEITSNILTYCRVTMTQSSDVDSVLLFSPDLTESSSMNNSIYGNVDECRRPSIGFLVKVIRTMLSRHASEGEIIKKLEYKLENMEALNIQDLKEIFGTDSNADQLTLTQQHKLASGLLKSSLTYKNKLMNCLLYAMETSLFLLWHHLDQYVVHAVAIESSRENILFPSRREMRFTPRRLQDISNVTYDESTETKKQALKPFEIDKLKSDLPTCLNDAFLKKLASVESKGSFIRPLVRRIQCLKLQFGK